MARQRAHTSAKVRRNSPTFVCVYIFWFLLLSLLATAFTILIIPPVTLLKAASSILVALLASAFVSKIYLRALNKCMKNNQWWIKQDKAEADVWKKYRRYNKRGGGELLTHREMELDRRVLEEARRNPHRGMSGQF